MATVTLKIQGGKELEAKLRELDRKASGALARKAMRAGAKVILPAVKDRAPKRSGTMAKSFKIRTAKRKRGIIAYQVQTKGGDYKGEAFYGAFVSFGHRVGSRKLGNKRRVVAPNPFIETAFMAKRQAALDAITDTLRQGLK